MDLNKQLIEKHNLNPTGVIVIGGWEGLEYDLLISNGFKDIVYIEPQKEVFKRLKEKAIGCTCLNCALGATNKWMVMFTETDNRGQSSSLLKPKVHTTQYPHIKFSDREIVKMRRMDDLGLNMRKYNTLLIDTQGYEIEVLKGAETSLQYVDIIIAEWSTAELYEGCPMWDELTEFLRIRGFKMVDNDAMGGNWGDALYVRTGFPEEKLYQYDLNENSTVTHDCKWNYDWVWESWTKKEDKKI